MSQEIGVELDKEEIEEFLKEQNMGVLGFANGGEAYTIPLTFAYDSGRGRCLFRFIMGNDSLKRAFVSETTFASLTTYEWTTKNQWVSVVARGPIEQIADTELAEAATLFSEVGEEAALEIFNSPIAEYEAAWYELEIAEVTGRGQYVGSRESLLSSVG